MTILITGASRGIGRALHDHYADAGSKVIGTYRGTAPDTGSWIKLDVADPDGPARIPEALDGQPIELLICNAGIFKDRGQPLADGYPASMWAETFAVNVTGVFLTIQALLPNLAKAKAPKIAIISSQMASQTKAGGKSYIYRASKAAVLNLGRNLAVDLKSDGIAVGIYHPGWVQSDMGGEAASITTEASATGLAARFADLCLDTTGCFQTWDGRDHPF